MPHFLAILLLSTLVASTIATEALKANTIASDGITTTVNKNNILYTQNELNQMPIVFDHKNVKVKIKNSLKNSLQNNLHETHPRRFRSSPNLIIKEWNTKNKNKNKNKQEELNISASGQPSASDFKKIYTAITNLKPNIQIYFIDLRKEFHGFINDLPISTYTLNNLVNYGKDTQTVEDEQRQLLNTLKNKKSIIIKEIKDKDNGVIKKSKDKHINIFSVSSEEDIIKSLGINSNYIRFYVDDRLAANPEEIDRFVKFIDQLENLKKEYWLHIHCRGGSGRASTFFIFVDMLRNAHNIPLKVIFERQKNLGGKDLSITKDQEQDQDQESNVKDNTKNNAKSDNDRFLEIASIKRKQLIEKFYQYAKERNNKIISKDLTWSKWVTSQKN